MGFKSKVAAVMCLTLAAGAVSTTAVAQATCRNTCDDNHVTCVNAGRSDNNVCLPQWRQCKVTCLSAPAKPAATPIAMSTSRPVASKH